MKKLLKIFIVFVLVQVSGFKAYTQTVTQKADTLQLKVKQDQAATQGDKQQAQGNAYGQLNKDNPSKSIKQVRGRRPDMSRARGARPPSIVRPSGSGIPKGVGRPGGVGRKGGR